MKVQRFLKSNNSEYVSLIKCGARHTQFRDHFSLVIKCQLALFVCIFQTDDCLILDISFKLVKSKASPFVIQSNDVLFKTCTERNIFKMTVLCFSLWEKSKAKTTHFRNHLSSRTKNKAQLQASRWRSATLSDGAFWAAEWRCQKSRASLPPPSVLLTVRWKFCSALEAGL